MCFLILSRSALCEHATVLRPVGGFFRLANIAERTHAAIDSVVRPSESLRRSPAGILNNYAELHYGRSCLVFLSASQCAYNTVTVITRRETGHKILPPESRIARKRQWYSSWLGYFHYITWRTCALQLLKLQLARPCGTYALIMPLIPAMLFSSAGLDPGPRASGLDVPTMDRRSSVQLRLLTPRSRRTGGTFNAPLIRSLL